MWGENESAPAALPRAASPSLATFTLLPGCVRNLGRVELGFDKREIDSPAPRAGVIRAHAVGMRPVTRT